MIQFKLNFTILFTCLIAINSIFIAIMIMRITQTPTSKNTFSWTSSSYGQNGLHGQASPKNTLNDLILELGDPTASDPRSNGIAIWMHKDPFAYVIIRDSHAPIQQTSEFVEAAIFLDVPKEREYDILQIAPGIMFNSVRKWAIVSGDSFESCLAKLALCKEVSEGQLTIHDIHTDKLVKTYINKMNPTDITFDIRFKDHLKNNLQMKS